MKLPAHARYDYVPIHKRPQYDWPEGKRLAVTFNNNIEHFAFGAGLGSDSTGAAADSGGSDSISAPHSQGAMQPAVRGFLSRLRPTTLP